jgi:hypothetical protein
MCTIHCKDGILHLTKGEMDCIPFLKTYHECDEKDTILKLDVSRYSIIYHLDTADATERLLQIIMDFHRLAIPVSLWGSLIQDMTQFTLRCHSDVHEETFIRVALQHRNIFQSVVSPFSPQDIISRYQKGGRIGVMMMAPLSWFPSLQNHAPVEVIPHMDGPLKQKIMESPVVRATASLLAEHTLHIRRIVDSFDLRETFVQHINDYVAGFYPHHTLKPCRGSIIVLNDDTFSPQEMKKYQQDIEMAGNLQIQANQEEWEKIEEEYTVNQIKVEETKNQFYRLEHRINLDFECTEHILPPELARWNHLYRSRHTEFRVVTDVQLLHCMKEPEFMKWIEEPDPYLASLLHGMTAITKTQVLPNIPQGRNIIVKPSWKYGRYIPFRLRVNHMGIYNVSHPHEKVPPLPDLPAAVEEILKNNQ